MSAKAKPPFTSANLVKFYRANLGLTQDEYADRLKIKGRSTIAKWEGGAKVPPHMIRYLQLDYLHGAIIFEYSRNAGAHIHEP